MRGLLATATIIALTAAMPSAVAETVYVIDKLLVGVHQDQDLNSAIIKVLPTGTELELVRREGELALVKDPAGVSGWVDGAYLMKEAPAGVRVEQLSRENKSLLARLAKTEPGEGPQPVDDAKTQAQIDDLAKDNTDLKRKLSAEKIKSGKLQTTVSEFKAQLANRPVTPESTRLDALEQLNKSLKRELEGAIQEHKRLENEIEDRVPVAVAPVSLDWSSKPVLIALAVLVVLSFGAGAYVVDFFNRRRHGGFRI